MQIHDLPVDAICLIVETLDRKSDINALGQVNRHLYGVVNPILYKRNINESNSALRWAITVNSLGTARKCLDFGAGVEDFGDADAHNNHEDGLSLICLAVHKFRPDILRLLLEHGANPNCGYGNCPRVPISVALELESGLKTVWIMLRESGVDWNPPRDPPLFRALFLSSLPIVKVLLSEGSEISKYEAAVGSEFSALAVAAYGGSQELVEYLLDEHGLDPNTAALDVAVERGHGHLVNLLVDRGLDAEAVDPDGLTPLHCAAMRGHSDIVRTLLGAGVRPNMRDVEGRTPLAWASVNGHLSAVEALLAVGEVDRDLPDRFGNTPLILAAHMSHAGVVTALLENGASSARMNWRGRTALSYVAQDGLLDNVRTFLDRDADVNERDAVGGTPICYAAGGGSADVVKLLLQRGADPEVRDAVGVGSLQLASKMGHEDVVLLLSRRALSAWHRRRLRGLAGCFTVLLGSACLAWVASMVIPKQRPRLMGLSIGHLFRSGGFLAAPGMYMFASRPGNSV